MQDTGKRTIEASEKLVKAGKIGGPFEKQKTPAFLKQRVELFERLYKEQEEKYAQIDKPEITVTLPDGKAIKGKAFQTTPLDIALGISKGLAEACVGAKIVYTNRLKNPLSEGFVDAEDDHEAHSGDVFDLTHRIEGDCKLELLKFETKEGKQIFWHSSAHLLGQSVENNYGGYLTHGPPLENGFFYDFYMGSSNISKENYEELEKEVEEIIKQNQAFQRLIIRREDAIKMFGSNPFKLAFINSKIPEGAATSVYRCGNLIDLCTGPHVPSTGKIKALKVTNSSSSYWLADAQNDSLQRVYGISFPSKKELDNYVKVQEELEKRDHRTLGEDQRLFAFHKYAPGCANFLPHGAKIYNQLVNLVRKEYRVRGFSEVKTSLMNNDQLWMTSGHFFKYRDNMYTLKCDDQGFGLKPMNCPIHCAIFDLHLHSYRDLPIRMADFGCLHRNEVHGALSGLTRVRQFHQDDAHIFCTEDQLNGEIKNCVDFLDYMYGLFGFNYSVEVSTRPELRMGSDELWDKAEEQLKEGLRVCGKEFKINAGDGAFYGPKIDIKVKDAFGRVHQLATIQLDFLLPERFNLQYRATDDETADKVPQLTEKELEDKIQKIKIEDNMIEITRQHKNRVSKGEEVTLEQVIKEIVIPNYNVSGKLKPGFKRPIMIHRAVLGSLERCIAILCEHYGGKWPFWLSPRQAVVIPISEKFEAYADRVYNRLVYEGYNVEVDHTNAGINKKVRNAQLAQFNYILVVGEKEAGTGTITLRERDQEKPKGVYKVDEVVQLLKDQHPEESNAWKELKKNSFFLQKDPELEKLNVSLLNKVYLSGEGFDHGAADEEAWALVKDAEIDPFAYPNLSRWKKFIVAKHIK
jgi:threonyl-tRNA synthetase